MRKRMFSCALAATMLASVLLNGVAFAASSEPAVNSYEVTGQYGDIPGFTVKRTMAVQYNCQQAPGETVNRSTIVGYCNSYIGRYRHSKQTAEGRYQDAFLIKVNMQPTTFKGTSGTKYYSMSQYLKLYAQLPNGCDLQSYSPTYSAEGKDVYTVGLSLTDVSGSVNIESDYCEKKDYSEPHKNLFHVAFDYKATWPWCSSARTNALYGNTWQMAKCEWTSTKKNYNVPLKVEARFGFDCNKGWSGYDLDMADGDGTYICNKQAPYSSSFGTK